MTPQAWQVWWTDFDPITGREQAGRRPALVIASATHTAMYGHSMTIVLPMTTRERPALTNRVKVSLPRGDGWVITDQPRAVSVDRLLNNRPVAVLDPIERAAVRTALRDMIDL